MPEDFAGKSIFKAGCLWSTKCTLLVITSTGSCMTLMDCSSAQLRFKPWSTICSHGSRVLELERNWLCWVLGVLVWEACNYLFDRLECFLILWDCPFDEVP